jgi:hypothetical protein
MINFVFLTLPFVCNIFFYFCGETPQSQLGRQIVEVCGSHRIRHKHAHPVGFHLKCDQLATCTTQDKDKELISMSSAGFETAIQAMEEP